MNYLTCKSNSSLIKLKGFRFELRALLEFAIYGVCEARSVNVGNPKLSAKTFKELNKLQKSYTKLLRELPPRK